MQQQQVVCHAYLIIEMLIYFKDLRFFGQDVQDASVNIPDKMAAKKAPRRAAEQCGVGDQVADQGRGLSAKLCCGGPLPSE